MKVNFNAIPITVNVRTGKNGKSYYDVTLEQDGEVMTLGANESIFGAISNLKYKPCSCVGSYVRSEFQGAVRTYFVVESIVAQK